MSPFVNPLEEGDDPDIETAEPDTVGNTSEPPSDESEGVTSTPWPKLGPASALAKGRAAVPVTKDKGTDEAAQYTTDRPTAVLVSVTQ